MMLTFPEDMLRRCKIDETSEAAFKAIGCDGDTYGNDILRAAKAYDRSETAKYFTNGTARVPSNARSVTKYCRLISHDRDDDGRPFLSCSVFVYTLDLSDRTVTDSLFIHDLTHSPLSLELFLRTVKREKMTCQQVLSFARMLADAEML